MKLKVFAAALLGVLMLGLAGCKPAATSSAAGAASSGTDAAAQPQTAEAASAALVFTTTDLDGNPADQSIFAGHTLTMMNVWGTFCGPCLREMPELAALAADYADQGVQIIGVIDDVRPGEDGVYPEADLATARDLVAETGANYTHLLYSKELSEAALADMEYVPTTIFVDEAGNVVGETYVGSRSGEDWAAIVDATLAEVSK